MLKHATRCVTVTCVMLALAAAALGQQKKAPKIVLSQEGWDFGKVWHGEIPKLDLTITNEGSAPLKLSRVKACCGGHVTQPNRMEIPPGESETVTLSFITERKQADVKSKLVIDSNDPEHRQVKFVMTGFVKRVITRDPAGGAIIRTLDPKPGQTGTVRLENQMDEPLKLKFLETNMPGIEVKATEITPGLTFEVTVRTTKEFEPGTIQGMMWFETGLTRQPKAAVPVWVTVVNEVEASPAAIYVKATSTEADKKIILLRNYGPQPFEVTGYSCPREDIHIALGPVQNPYARVSRKSKNRLLPNCHVQATIMLPPGNTFSKEGFFIEFTTNNAKCPKVELLVTTDVTKYQEKIYGKVAGRQ